MYGERKILETNSDNSIATERGRSSRKKFFTQLLDCHCEIYGDFHFGEGLGCGCWEILRGNFVFLNNF